MSSYPDHIATIGLYFKLQSIEAARSHLIMTSVLHSIFNFIQRFVSVGHIDLSSSSFEDDELMFVFIVMIWKIAEWSPSSRQALLGAGLGTTITKILQSRLISFDSSCIIANATCVFLEKLLTTWHCTILSSYLKFWFSSTRNKTSPIIH